MEMIIFIGIQATGKSTFYKSCFFNTHARISLDLLRTRNRENQFIETCFSTKMPFVIDNTNPTKIERTKYIDLAKRNKYKVICYFFQSKLEDAIKRNKMREGRSLVPEIGIKGAFNKLEIPTFDEGYDEMYYVQIDNNEFKIKDWKNEV